MGSVIASFVKMAFLVFSWWKKKKKTNKKQEVKTKTKKKSEKPQVSRA